MGVALACLLATLAPLPAAPGPLVVVRSCPAGDCAALALVCDLGGETLPAREAGATALLAEVFRARIAHALAHPEGGAAAVLKTAVPSLPGVEVAFEPDQLSVTVNCIGSAVPAAADALRQILVEPPLTQREFDRARAVVLRRREAWIGAVAGHTAELMMQALSAGRFGQPLYGTPASLAGLDLGELEGVRKRFLSTGTTCISVEWPGSETDAKLLAALGKLAKSLPAGGERVARPPWRGHAGTEVDDHSAPRRASLVIGFAAPRFGESGFWVARVLRETLAGPKGSLILDRGLAASLGLAIPSAANWQRSPVQPLAVDVSAHPYLGVHIVCAPTAVQAALDGVLRHLRALAAGELSAADLARAQARTADDWARDTSSSAERAPLRATAALLGAELPDCNQVTRLADGVSADDIRNLAAQMLKGVAVGVQMPRD